MLAYIPFIQRSGISEPRYEKTGFLHMLKQRRRSALRLTAKLISAFVFAKWIVQSLLLPKPLAIFCCYIARFVSDPVGNPEDRFSQSEAHFPVGQTRHCSLVVSCLLCKQVAPKSIHASSTLFCGVIVPSLADTRRANCQSLANEWAQNTGELPPGGLALEQCG